MSGFETGFLINEAYAHFMEWENPVGQVIGKHQVVGVIKDFHSESLHHEIQPATFKIENSMTKDLTIRLSGSSIFEAMEYIQKSCKSVYPDDIFEYFFYDDHFDQMYRSAADIRLLLTCGALFALIVSCLGLAGLSLFSIQTRVQEIGIRKVMGGTMSGIVLLLSKDFFKLILIANIFAWPLAWFAMRQWLQNYAYRINLQWWMFVLAGFIALVIAMITVSVQAWKAAVTNPVESLRYE